MTDTRSDEEVLNDCIKKFGYVLNITNNAENRMIYEALIEKRIHDYPKSIKSKEE